jgi:hypothetical protein
MVVVLSPLESHTPDQKGCAGRRRSRFVCRNFSDLPRSGRAVRWASIFGAPRPRWVRRLAAPGEDPYLRPPSPAPWRDAKSPQEAVESLLLWEDHLSGWEAKFLNSLLHRTRRYTPRQAEVLRNIGEKVDRCIRSWWATTS